MLGRGVDIDPARAALLFIDVQNYTARPDGGEYRGVDPSEMEERYGYFFRRFPADRSRRPRQGSFGHARLRQ